MNRKNIYDDKCPVLYALSIIGGKWRLSILWHLKDGNLRYNQLKRELNGITNIMLTRSLQDLEEYGLVKRVQYSEIPPHVEYFLTENAKKLIPVIKIIQEWGVEQLLMNKKN
ncbi:helix-turn-helix domain-containing protein [Clostridium sp.]|uniref:winged helix-turn-helix transcriptional regulator n=1 Tax=Clostridium sp. TaxID=1506 RepID=UPI00263417E5|nr:helix-turn-helix domain-containing protein [Clostridium sp.]